MRHDEKERENKRQRDGERKNGMMNKARGRDRQNGYGGTKRKNNNSARDGMKE